MRKTKVSPKVIAAMLATVTILNTTAPAIVHAEDNPNPVQAVEQVQQSEAQQPEAQQPAPQENSNNQSEQQSAPSNLNDCVNDSNQNNNQNDQAAQQQAAAQDPQQQAPAQDPQQQAAAQDPQQQPASQNNQSTIFDDAVNVTDQDKTDIKNEMKEEDQDMLSWLKNRDAQAKKEAIEAAKKAAEEAAEKKREENINKAGEIAGQLLVKIAKTDYKNKDEMIKDVATTTLQLMNEGFIKNIPYGGGFFHAVVQGALQGDSVDPTTQAIKDNGEKLDNIYKAINDCAKKLLDQGDNTVIHEKLVKINEAAKLLDRMYKNNNASFIHAIEEQAKDAAVRSKNGPADVFDRIYRTNDNGIDQENYFNNYMSFTDLILNDRELMQGYENFGDNSDIFALFKQITTNGKTDIVEFQEARGNLTKTIKNYLENGYNVLKYTMDYDLAKQMNVQAAAEAKIAKLTELLKYADEESKDALQEQINEYKDIAFKCNDNITRTQDRIDELNGRKDAFTKRIDDYQKEMKADQERFDNYKPVEQITKDHMTFTKQKIGDKVVYPSISEDDENVIEYRDIYGNLVRTQHVSPKYTKVDQYDVKEGNVYKMSWTETHYSYIIWKRLEQKEAYVKVNRVYEDDRIGGLYTIRTIEGTDLTTGKTIKLTIGQASPECATVYEKTVSPLVKSK